MKCDPLSLYKPETSHLPETGFVYNSIEASDALVCQYHVSELRGTERCATSYETDDSQYWDGFQAPWFRRFMSKDRGSIWFSAELQHNNRTLKDLCCSSSLTACVMTHNSFQANTKHMLPVTGSQLARPVWLLHVKRNTGSSLCCTCCAASLPWDSLLKL